MLPVPEGPEEEFWVLSEVADIDHIAMMKVQSIFDMSSVTNVDVVYTNQLGEFDPAGRIHLMQIRIQHFRFNRYQYGHRVKMKKNLQLKKITIYLSLQKKP
jgi:hypothetical protein